MTGALIQASWLLGALSGPHVLQRYPATISARACSRRRSSAFVGCFGESAIPVIMGGVGYQLMGNTITSAMDVLNYPLAAAMSTVVVLAMMVLLLSWYLVFDARASSAMILRSRG